MSCFCLVCRANELPDRIFACQLIAPTSGATHAVRQILNPSNQGPLVLIRSIVALCADSTSQTSQELIDLLRSALGQAVFGWPAMPSIEPPPRCTLTQAQCPQSHSSYLHPSIQESER
jgi:hypothetical protein